MITGGGPGRAYWPLLPAMRGCWGVGSTAQEGCSVGFGPPAHTGPGSLRACARLLVSVVAVGLTLAHHGQARQPSPHADSALLAGGWVGMMGAAAVAALS